MGLLVVQILQAVLEPAQEDISLGKFADRAGGQQIAFAKHREHGERGPVAERSYSSPADQLEQLHDEFDFAYAAGTELDVVGEIPPLDLAADLPVQLAQRPQRVVVEMAPVDEGSHQFVELRLTVACEYAALDPGIALPFAALGCEVAFQRFEARTQRSAVTVGPQTHVHPEHVAAGGHFGQHCNQLASQAREVFVIADRTRAGGLAVLGIGEYQVDVRRDVELGASQFAHADYVESLDPAPAVRNRMAVLRAKQ